MLVDVVGDLAPPLVDDVVRLPAPVDGAERAAGQGQEFRVADVGRAPGGHGVELRDGGGELGRGELVGLEAPAAAGAFGVGEADAGGVGDVGVDVEEAIGVPELLLMHARRGEGVHNDDVRWLCDVMERKNRGGMK